MTHWFTRRGLCAFVTTTLLLALGACGNPAALGRQERAKIAQALFEERCKKAGVFIHRTVKDVDGILVMKLRPRGRNFGEQFVLDDPYGDDLNGDGYLESFLRGSYQAGSGGRAMPPGAPPRFGFRFVEAVDPADGKRYRYTGEIRDFVVTPSPVFSSNKVPFTTRGFVMDKAVAPGAAPRYGVTYDDISTRQEREYWIAGSSLRVVDTQTGEVLAERVGYMWDRGQGDDFGGRSPWQFAARQACPSFYEKSAGAPSLQARPNQVRQTQDFVEAVLKPAP